jgi:Ca2+-binding RTX toxin-like protein
VGSLGGGTGQLGGTLTVTDTGTATTDSVTISSQRAATQAALNVFNTQNITSAGYESVTIGGGSAANASPVAQALGTVAINSDSTSSDVSLAITGTNLVTLAGATSNSSGRFTIDASALGVAASVQATFTMNAAPTFTGGVTGTLSVVGGAGADTLLGLGNTASTVSGGAGNDAITGGTAADSLVGGAGDDSITGAGGNDTLVGNEGDDTITATVAGSVSIDGGAGNDIVNVGDTLSALDTIAGGDGTDRLQITGAAAAANAPTASVLANVTGFETLRVAAALGTNVDLIQFTNNNEESFKQEKGTFLLTIIGASSITKDWCPCKRFRHLAARVQFSG